MPGVTGSVPLGTTGASSSSTMLETSARDTKIEEDVPGIAACDVGATVAEDTLEPAGHTSWIEQEEEVSVERNRCCSWTFSFSTI